MEKEAKEEGKGEVRGGKGRWKGREEECKENGLIRTAIDNIYIKLKSVKLLSGFMSV